MRVDVFDYHNGKYLGTRYDVVTVRTGQLYYVIEDEKGNEYHYHFYTYKLIITANKN